MRLSNPKSAPHEAQHPGHHCDRDKCVWIIYIAVPSDSRLKEKKTRKSNAVQRSSNRKAHNCWRSWSITIKSPKIHELNGPENDNNCQTTKSSSAWISAYFTTIPLWFRVPWIGTEPWRGNTSQDRTTVINSNNTNYDLETSILKFRLLPVYITSHSMY